MNTKILGTWVESAGEALRTGWSKEALERLAGLEVPPEVLGDLGWAIRGDAAATWARWFVDSFVDSAAFMLDEQRTYAQLYSDLLKVLRCDFPAIPLGEIQDLAARVSTVAWQEILYLRNTKRVAPSRQQRRRIWQLSGANQRCYLCGYRFSAEAREAFLLNNGVEEIRQPPLLDFVRPRGRNKADLSIQVDHVRPVAHGGPTVDDNLRLACGWCNNAKSGHMQIYDGKNFFKYRMDHPTLGWISIPQPLWVVRCVQIRARCEHPEECSATLGNNELFVACRREGGALTPNNCAVYCREHDPWRGIRFVGENLLPERK